jgi:hypothetical protein
MKTTVLAQISSLKNLVLTSFLVPSLTFNKLSMRKLLLLWMLSMGLTVSAQDYAYPFSGNLSETAQAEFLKRMEDFHFYTDVKLRYKNDSQKGELLFSIPVQSAKTEEEAPYSILDVKQLLLSFDLLPDTFVERTKH